MSDWRVREATAQANGLAFKAREVREAYVAATERYAKVLERLTERQRKINGEWTDLLEHVEALALTGGATNEDLAEVRAIIAEQREAERAHREKIRASAPAIRRQINEPGEGL